MCVGSLLLHVPGSRAAWVPPVYLSAPQRTACTSVCTLPLRFPLCTLSLPNSRSPTPSNLSPLSSPCLPVRALPPPYHNTRTIHSNAHTLFYTRRPQATTHPWVIGASSACSAPSGSTKCTAIPPSRKSRLSSSCATISTASMIRTFEG